MAKLEEKLGELSGQLLAIAPALNRVGGRADENRDRIVALETEMDNIKSIVRRSGSRWWDIAKIIIAAGVGAVITLIATGKV
jgi:hypothetical protein